MRNSLIPASFAISGETVSLWPVQRMMGMSGLILRSSLAELNPGDARHGLIGDDEIELGRIGREGLQGLCAVSQGSYLIAETFKGGLDPIQRASPHRRQRESSSVPPGI